MGSVEWVHCALNPAYCMTICKTQGANIKKLILWFDCPTVPKGMGYVALSRVWKSEDIKILTPMVADQLTPALTWTRILQNAWTKDSFPKHHFHRPPHVARNKTVVVDSDAPLQNLCAGQLQSQTHLYHRILATPLTLRLSCFHAIPSNSLSNISWTEIHIPCQRRVLTRQRTISQAIFSLQLCHDAVKICGRQRPRPALSISNTLQSIS